MNRTGTQNQGKSYVFQGALEAHTNKLYEMDIVANGYIDNVSVKFAAGENGTLHIKPIVIQNGEIPMEMVNFAVDLNPYISGDDEKIELPCYLPVENGSKIRVIAENTGDYTSYVDVIVSVQYHDMVTETSVIG